MKKIVLSLVILLGVVCLTGCDSNVDAVDGMLNALKSDGIVDEIGLVDKVTKLVQLYFLLKLHIIFMKIKIQIW